jgi:(1->4)-alpha-D-glucan 1-alpha-D-glucosylmutase
MEADPGLTARIPVSTYRVQLNRAFTFRDARDIVPYLNELGITDLYTSPFFRARKGSLHGYDLVDPHMLNPEIGTWKEYTALVEELKKYGMGQVLDIVPNHMCIEGGENPWWTDVLENGQSSRYAQFFDIDWHPVKKELDNKVLLPVLGDQYGRVLEDKELELRFQEGAFWLHYFDHRFPILPETYDAILGHRIEELESHLSTTHPCYIEILSIITAVRHLPRYTEPDPERVAERHREKEVIKKRLQALYVECREVASFIDENVRLFNGSPGEAASFNLLDNLLSWQAYRLAFWRVATDEINYRRFFDINSLAAIRVEDPLVFDELHKLVFALIRRGALTGLRVDHPDGLYDPSAYFNRLQRACFAQSMMAFAEGIKMELPPEFDWGSMKEQIEERYFQLLEANPDSKPFYIVGEKILTKSERMPEEWPIFSTTGYVFLNSLNGIFIEGGHTKQFDRLYSKFTRITTGFQDTAYEKKKLVMQVAMAGEINTLSSFLDRLSEKDRLTRDFTLNSMKHALIEIIACFPVYRTYINSYDVKDRDRQQVDAAVAKAKRRNSAFSGPIFDFIDDVLLLKFPDHFNDTDKKEWLDFVMRFQQITGPVMAKGLEDTAFYVHNRLASLNEVGGNPEKFGTSLETLHGQNIERSKFWPHALIASSTHDTKRSEDTRARINVLSEIPMEWADRLTRWARLNKRKKVTVNMKSVPDRNEEYLLYQTLLGAWPIGMVSDEAHTQFAGRIKEYTLKALKEAKIHTSWIDPDPTYEEAATIFIDTILSRRPDNEFLQDFVPFQKMVSDYGLYNSLSQTLVKITSPGVPDFYQGTETWQFALVDPDNRRPVDFAALTRMRADLGSLEKESDPITLARELTVTKEDGRIKLFVTSRALAFRKARREIFEKGEYLPVELDGEKSRSMCAFARRFLGEIAITVVPRFFTKLIAHGTDLPFGSEVWKDTALLIPFAGSNRRYVNQFTGEVLTTPSHGGAVSFPVGDVLANFPVALLTSEEGQPG